MSRRSGGGPSATQQQQRMNFNQGGGKKFVLKLDQEQDRSLNTVTVLKFSFSEKATKICAILLMVLTFT